MVRLRTVVISTTLISTAWKILFFKSSWTPRTEIENNNGYLLLLNTEIGNNQAASVVAGTTTTTDHHPALVLSSPNDDYFEQKDSQHNFCIEWKRSDALNRTLQPIDLWWLHHPDYFVSTENTSHVCFERDVSSRRAVYHINLYQNQFNTTCETVYQRYMWSSGWGADLSNVVGGMKVAMDRHHVPLIMNWDPRYDKKGWHYAENKQDSSNKTCQEADLSCYFLPLHPCSKNIESTTAKVIQGDDAVTMTPSTSIGLWIYQYVTRPQLWLRRAIMDFKASSSMDLSPGGDECSVIHVRRGDVVLHGEKSRQYYAIEDYVNLLPDEVLKTHNILLLTDDANAISEALEFYPNVRWKYLKRPRHRGSRGGWENQTPSQNPAQEVITILATFQWVQQCTHLVHSESSFAIVLWDHMVSVARRQLPTRQIFQHRVDQRMPVQEKFSSANANSANQLKMRLFEMRRQRRRKPNSSQGVAENHPTEPNWFTFD